MSSFFGIFDIFVFYLLTAFVGYKIIHRIIGRFIWIDNWRKKSIFITGCDTGFGHETALKLTDYGLTVFAGCYTKEGENLLRNSRPGATNLYTVMLDVTDDKSVQSAREFVLKTLKQKSEKLWAVINNAGITETIAPDEWITNDHYRRLMEVNVYGYRSIVQAFLPSLKASKGRILLVSSIRGRFAFPLAGPYTLTKFSIEAYADTIRRQLYDFGIKVSVINPGGFETPAVKYFKAQVLTNVKQCWNGLSPEVKAEYGEHYIKGIVSSLENFGYDNQGRGLMETNVSPVVMAYCEAVLSKFPRYRYVVGWDCWKMFLPMSYMPESVQDLWVRKKFMTRYRESGGDYESSKVE